MEEAMIEPGERLGQHPAFAGGVARLLRGESADKIGATDNADDPAIAQHRDPLYAMCRQQSRGLAEFPSPRPP